MIENSPENITNCKEEGTFDLKQFSHSRTEHFNLQTGGYEIFSE